MHNERIGDPRNAYPRPEDLAPKPSPSRRSRVRRFLTEPSPMHSGMRLCDLLPILPIGVLLLILWPDSNGWAAVLLFALAFVSMYLTKRFIR